MPVRAAVLSCLVLAALGGTPAAAQAPESMGLIGPELLIGPDPEGPWTGSTQDGRYVLTNKQDPGSIYYSYIEGASLPSPPDISVRVQAAGPAAGPDGLIAGAGLIYALRQDPLSYYALTLSSDGTLRVLQRDADGLHEMISTSGSGFDTTAAHELRIVGVADGFQAFLDGLNITEISSPGTGPGGAGIIAVGAGRFAFEDFAAVQAAAAPDGGAQTGPDQTGPDQAGPDQTGAEQTGVLDSVPPAPDGDPLRAMLDTLLTTEMPDNPADASAAAIDCMMTAFAPLSDKDRQMLIARSMDLDQQEVDRLDQRYPGLVQAVEACF